MSTILLNRFLAYFTKPKPTLLGHIVPMLCRMVHLHIVLNILKKKRRSWGLLVLTLTGDTEVDDINWIEDSDKENVVPNARREFSYKERVQVKTLRDVGWSLQRISSIQIFPKAVFIIFT